MKEFFVDLGIGWLVGINLLMMYTFYLAYFHVTKSVTVYVNVVGEANLEAVVFPILFLISVYAVYQLYKRKV